MSASGGAALKPLQIVAVDGSCTLTPEEIGGKAWGVNRMRSLGLPVPPAIVATIHACREYYLGINAGAEAALAAESGDARYAADTYRRFVEQYRKVVLGGRADPVPEDPWIQLHTCRL